MSDFAEELKQEQAREEALMKGADSLEARVKVLEEGLRTTQALLTRLVHHLEVKFQEDIDDDNHIGSRIC